MSVRFLVFADLHYRAIPDGQARLDFLLKQSQGCDFILNLGDTCLPEEASPELTESLSRLNIPVYSILGNHDADKISRHAVMRSLRMENSWYSVTYGSVKIIALDSCWIRRGRCCLPYEAGILQDGDVYPVLPPEELRWLEEELSDGTPYYILCLHHSLDNKWVSRSVQNKSRVRELIRHVNCCGKSRVICVLSGHDHATSLVRLDGVPYFSVNSASYQWFRVSHRTYEEHLETYPLLEHVILFDEPLYATVDVSDSGEICVQGSRSHYRGITPDELQIGKRWNNRPTGSYIYNWRSGEVLEVGALELESYGDLWDLSDNLNLLRHDMCQGRRRMFVFRDGGKNIGGMGLLIQGDDNRLVIPGKRARLCLFAIKPEYRNQGTGTQLLRSISRILTQEGYEELSILVEEGSAMHSMCRHMGFEARSVWSDGRLLLMQELG